jgi:nucleoside-diphosphate-sugar epimerase
VSSRTHLPLASSFKSRGADNHASVRFVAGPPLVVPESSEKLGETYEFIFKILAGGELTSLAPGFNWYVDVRDVGRLIVYGVEQPAAANGERIIASTGYAPPQAVADILRAAYPERQSIIKEGTVGEGYVPGFAKSTVPANVDGSKGAKALGGAYTPFEQVVLDTAKSLEGLL